ncbi:MAG: hypothetical protein WAW06_12035, partial [bacterium]
MDSRILREHIALAAGGIQFYRNDDGNQAHAWLEFEAHQGTSDSDARGQARYHDEDGNKLTIDITCVAVWGDCATFSGQAVRTNVDEWDRVWFLLWVHDGGSPGINGDGFAADLFDQDPGCSPGTMPRDWMPVIGGNLVVHPLGT